MKLIQVTQYDANDKMVCSLFINVEQILMITFDDPKHKGRKNLVKFVTGDGFWVEDGPATFRKGGVTFEV